MVSWVSQEIVSSATPHARGRTAYLETLRPQVERVVRQYLASNPSAEDVTLEVLSQVGRDRLWALRDGRTLGRLKQDLGLLVAQVLVDAFSPACVFTLRDGTGAPAGRRNTREDLEWVAKYSPHRIAPTAAGLSPERVVLDSTCVRDFVEQDANGLDVTAMLQECRDHPVSIADHAVAELSAALLRGSIDFRKWHRRAALLDGFLDPRYPVAPGGVERSNASGLIDVDVVEEMSVAYQRAVWRHLRNAHSLAVLKQPTVFEGPNKQVFQINVEPHRVELTLQREGRRWERLVERMAAALHAQSRPVQEAELADVIRANLGRDLADDQLARIDLPVRVLAKRAVQASAGYKGKKVNDAMDLDLLFYVAMPAYVCTRDNKLIRMALATGSPDAHRVMTPSSLAAHFRGPTK